MRYEAEVSRVPKADPRTHGFRHNGVEGANAFASRDRSPSDHKAERALLSPSVRILSDPVGQVSSLLT